MKDRLTIVSSKDYIRNSYSLLNTRLTTNSENVSDSFEIYESFIEKEKKHQKVEYLSRLPSSTESPIKDEELREALSKNVFQKG